MKTGWGVTLPWLSYVEEASDVRDGTDIEMQLTFASEMRIVLAKYSLDGTWLGLEEMSTQVRSCRGGGKYSIPYQAQLQLLAAMNRRDGTCRTLPDEIGMGTRGKGFVG